MPDGHLRPLSEISISINSSVGEFQASPGWPDVSLDASLNFSEGDSREDKSESHKLNQPHSIRGPCGVLLGGK